VIGFYIVIVIANLITLRQLYALKPPLGFIRFSVIGTIFSLVYLLDLSITW